MIPLHRPPFGIGTVMVSMLPGGERRSLQRLEESYAEASGCAAAVWLPSARAGICWALRAAIGIQTTVIGPAFTCAAVHEAMVRSGGNVRLLEPGESDFLMDERTLFESLTGNYALVLCEAYGHGYDLVQLQARAVSPPVVRIVDMAMSVPHPALFQGIRSNDFAVISFGQGKSMYAGWGSMGFCRDLTLAREVRRLRDALLAPGVFGLLLQRAARVSLQTAAHYPPVYSIAWKLWYPGRAALTRVKQVQPGGSSEMALKPPPVGFPAAWSDNQSRSKEWSLPSTRLDRGLASRNLQQAESAFETRLALARRYHENLQDAKAIICPKVSPYALSHYTIRVGARIRNSVKQRLLKDGIYTISLWTFPPHLDKDRFPATFRASSEVINLPLAPWMSNKHVDWVCERVIQCVETCLREPLE